MSGEKETFRTYANYIRAFTELAGLPSFAIGQRRLAQLRDRIAGNAVQVEPQAEPTLAYVRSSLINAWGTEMILNITMTYAQEDELVGLTNNWAAVQLYYAVYHATQALLLARGYQRPENHPQTQRMFADMWVNRNASLAPWSLGVGSDGIRNGPGRDVDLGIHPWTACNPATCWDLAAKAIRTTRDDAVVSSMSRLRLERQKELRRAFDARPQRRRRTVAQRVPLPRLSADDKSRVDRRIRPYTFLDFLYRLRLKTNYEDATVFVDGPESPAEARLVRRDLAFLAAASLLLNELHIELAIGEAAVRGWADSWLQTNHPGGRLLGLARRRELL
jgi:hypothetical protein